MKKESDYQSKETGIPNYVAYCSVCKKNFKSYQDPCELQGLPLQSCPLCHNPMRVEPIMPEPLFEQDYKQLSIECLL